MTLKIGTKGFTLMEVMVSTVVLSLGTVLIYSSFLTSLDSFNRYVNYLNVIPWMDQRLWLAQDDLNRLGDAAVISPAGDFQKAGRDFKWSLNYSPVDDNLYQVNLELSWQQGSRKAGLARSAYAEYKQRE